VIDFPKTNRTCLQCGGISHTQWTPVICLRCMSRLGWEPREEPGFLLLPSGDSIRSTQIQWAVIVVVILIILALVFG